MCATNRSPDRRSGAAGRQGRRRRARWRARRRDLPPGPPACLCRMCRRPERRPPRRPSRRSTTRTTSSVRPWTMICPCFPCVAPPALSRHSPSSRGASAPTRQVLLASCRISAPPVQRASSQVRVSPPRRPRHSPSRGSRWKIWMRPRSMPRTHVLKALGLHGAPTRCPVCMARGIPRRAVARTTAPPRRRPSTPGRMLSGASRPGCATPTRLAAGRSSAIQWATARTASSVGSGRPATTTTS